ncbi:unnamed protein product [Gulo gulo]|uniref:Uncharacterized protein n=1 Tax=Gulo gulo TaxID=48420 RepID=A0A9X9PTF7_GULGU|nr:unnamed protein product [Gulo gulo]
MSRVTQTGQSQNEEHSPPGSQPGHPHHRCTPQQAFCCSTQERVSSA